MIEEDLFEQEIQKKKRRVLVLLVCLFVLAGGGFVARRASLAEEPGAGGTTPVTALASLSTPAETPEAGESTVPAEDNIQTPTVEKALSEQAGEETIVETDGGPVAETPAERVTTAETESPADTATPVAGNVESASGTGGGADKSIVDGEDGGESQTGDEIALDAGTGGDKETTTGADGAERESEDSDQADAGVAPADELADGDQLEANVTIHTTDEADTEGKTVEQDSAQGQESDFQPPPVQLPVTGSIILNWNVAPVVAVSLLVLLVGAGAISLFSKHRRY